ncbi:hypothetical protein DH2020_030583 [Rehmannia glutinosa]|uniref:Uncharacterized protein n=1 Tax=Rehmannia glutinosa TaxID=99300 RepID=A0ABR0VKD3_REHGL
MGLSLSVRPCFTRQWLFIPERATSLAFSVLGELVEELRCGLCPVVFASFSGGSKACMYKVLQIIEGCSDVELSLEDSRLVASCISGQIYDSDPIEFTTDLGLDALFITRFGSQRAEYWQTLYSSVGLGAPFLILCSENDDVAPFSTLRNFAQRLQDMGGNVKVVKWNTSTHIGHHKHRSKQCTAAVTELLEQAISIFTEKIQKLGEKSCIDDMHDEISLICDLQNAAVDSNQSFRRVAVGPNDHFFLPSSSEHANSREIGSIQQERKERLPHRSSPPCMSANSVLGQTLFDVCVPKNVEGWDIKFSGSLNGEPFASVRKRSLFGGIKHRSRL